MYVLINKIADQVIIYSLYLKVICEKPFVSFWLFYLKEC